MVTLFYNLEINVIISRIKYKVFFFRPKKLKYVFNPNTTSHIGGRLSSGHFSILGFPALCLP